MNPSRDPHVAEVRAVVEKVAQHYRLSVAAWMAAEKSALAEPRRAMTVYRAILRSLEVR